MRREGVYARASLHKRNAATPAMNLVKKILIVHADAKMKRRLVLLLADAGYDLRSYVKTEPALETARSEWFDLALVDAQFCSGSDFSFVEGLRKIQPTVPVVLVVPQLDLSLIVKGIGMGLSDVLPANNDLRPLLRRVNSLLRPNSGRPGEEEALTPTELAEAEAVLQALGSTSAASAGETTGAASEWRQELVRNAKEHAAMKTKAERLEHEKSVLESELKTLLAQNEDAIRLQADVAELRSQRETVVAAQSLIDQKSTALSEARSELARERSALEEERRRLAQAQSASPFTKDPEQLSREQTELEQARARLAANEVRLREESTRIQQQTTQLAQERRRWHDDLDLLREQENNLREYEARLRQLQAQLEADRVLWFSSRPQSRSPFYDDAAVKAAWEKLQRATDLLEAERAVFRDERMALRELEADIKRREAKLDENSNKLADQEKRLRSLPSPAQSNPPMSVVNPSSMSGSGRVRAISRAPFEMAKSLLGRNKPDET